METEEIRATGWVKFGHYGKTHYRIWHRKTAFAIFQRHEWKLEDGSTDMEEWIATPFKDFGSGMAPVAECAA